MTIQSIATEVSTNNEELTQAIEDIVNDYGVFVYVWDAIIRGPLDGNEFHNFIAITADKLTEEAFK